MKHYFRTEKGVLKRIFHHIKERKIKHNFSYEEFCNWCYENNFKKKYDCWVKSNYNNKIKPSVDRIDDYGIYDFSNMQLITWNENWRKGIDGKKNISAYKKNFRKGHKQRQYKVIITKDNFKKDYKNVVELKKDFPYLQNSKITECVKGRRPHHFGFTFKKIDEVVAQ